MHHFYNVVALLGYNLGEFINIKARKVDIENMEN